MIGPIRFISAGAGSGKTYRITEELQAMLASGDVQPGGVIATTFTRMAANELRERVRQKLIAAGHTRAAAQMGQALINTVNGVCGQLLLRFSFEAGLSPEQKVLEEEQGKLLFGAALESELSEQVERVEELNAMAHRLGKLDDRYQPDWRGEIMTVADAARSNNMTPSQLRGFAQSGSDELLAFFEQPYRSGRDLAVELEEAIDNAIDGIDTAADKTKTTDKYIALLRNCRSRIRRQRLPWSDWVKLSKARPAKKSEGFAEPIQMIAGEFERCHQLHDDVREFSAEVFRLAADSLEKFQALKARQGVLDYVDQERLLYGLLDDPHVRQTLAAELQVLFVDEFQDTSPIQLALFMKLAELADHVVWVGDTKQAIYGFRGSDPALMLAVLEGVGKDGTTDVLEYSWRSRPALVEYANEVFKPTFADILAEDQVTLEPKREEQLDTAAVVSWQLGGSNVARRAGDMAYGIQQMIDAGQLVIDKQTGEPRPVQVGDIAVLCRTNDRLKAVAGACAAAGIPVAFKRPHLLQTPEGVLALACLRRLADKRDTLASAEIRTLAMSESPEDWLAERLAYLQGDEPSWAWGEAGDGEIAPLRSLAECRSQLAVLTPSEALELALVKGGVREAAIAWGPTSDHTRHRLRNIDLLLEYAATYEDQCDMLNVAATVAGLILWFNDLAGRQEDWQAEAGDGRAISLLTHHGAKGLEWPVVLAMDLGADIRPRLWDLTVRQREDGVDLHDPLAGRRLRYWPWPFGRQSTGIPVADRIEADAVGIEARQSAVAETRRLLYVSMTRARDLLVLPMPAKKPGGEWLDALCVDWVLPESEALTLPSGKTIPTACEEVSAPDDWQVEDRPYEARWVLPGQPRVDLVNRNLTPSSAEPLAQCQVGEIIEIGERLRLDGVTDVRSLGEALHGIIAAEVVSPGDDKRVSRILRDWDCAGKIDPAAVLAAARAFARWAEATFKPVSWHVEYPVTHRRESGQVVQGFIDLLLETEDGWVIVDHKAAPQPRNKWQAIAEDYSGQLAMYKEAVEAVTGRPVTGAYLHFPVGGGVVRVSV